MMDPTRLSKEEQAREAVDEGFRISNLASEAAAEVLDREINKLLIEKPNMKGNPLRSTVMGMLAVQQVRQALTYQHTFFRAMGNEGFLKSILNEFNDTEAIERRAREFTLALLLSGMLKGG